MNHIYKTIFNKKTGEISVVSEKTSSNCQSQQDSKAKTQNNTYAASEISPPSFLKKKLVITVATFLTSTLSELSYASNISIENVNDILGVIPAEYKVAKYTGDINELISLNNNKAFYPSMDGTTPLISHSGVFLDRVNDINQNDQPNIIYGGYSDQVGVSTSNNFVSIKDSSSISSNIYGSYSKLGNSDGVVNLDNATTSSYIRGAYSDNSDATGSVFIINGSTANNVWGADAHNAIGKVLIKNDSKINLNVYGVSASNNGTGEVEIIDSQVLGNIKGVDASNPRGLNKDELSNFKGTVSLVNSSAQNIHGVYNNINNSAGEINGVVHLNNGSTVKNVTFGVVSFGDSTANIRSEIISNVSHHNGDIYGVNGDGLDIKSDIEINNSSVDGNIYGVQTETSNNKSISLISINDSTVNTVTGSYILTTPETATTDTQNTINLGGTIQVTNLIGSLIDDTNVDNYDIFNKNTLNIRSQPITVNRLQNFKNYNFYINDNNSSIVNDSTKSIITVENDLINDGSKVNGEEVKNTANYQLIGISGKYEPSPADKINLLTLNGTAFHGANASEFSSLFTDNATKESHLVDVGLTKETKVSYSIEENSLVAYFEDGTVSKKRAEGNLKPLAEGHLASLMNITRTTDLIANNILSGSEMNDGDYSPFVIFEGGHDRYNSGSHIKSTSYRGIFGGKYKLNDFTLGGFVTYGGGDYDTYNSIDTKEFNGQGNARHYGLGFITKYEPETTNYYIDSSLEFGKSRNRFDSDIITGGGTKASFRNDRNYVSGHIGTGYVYPFNDKNTLDSSFKYLTSHISSDQVVIDGENINLHSLTSSRLQLKTEWLHQYTSVVGLIGAIGYEHEFDAKAGISVDNYNLADQPSLKGGTGIVEMGLTYNPFKSTTNEFIDFRIKGSTGEREGISALINLKHTF